MSGVYCSVSVSTEQGNINKVITELKNVFGHSQLVDPEDYHSTLLYSRVGNAQDIECVPYLCIAHILDIELWDTHDTCIVAKLDCPALQIRHKHLMEKHDLQWDYEEYKPHITLAYDLTPTPPELEILRSA